MLSFIFPLSTIYSFANWWELFTDVDVDHVKIQGSFFSVLLKSVCVARYWITSLNASAWTMSSSSLHWVVAAAAAAAPTKYKPEKQIDWTKKIERKRERGRKHVFTETLLYRTDDALYFIFITNYKVINYTLTCAIINFESQPKTLCSLRQHNNFVARK